MATPRLASPIMSPRPQLLNVLRSAAAPRASPKPTHRLPSAPRSSPSAASSPPTSLSPCKRRGSTSSLLAHAFLETSKQTRYPPRRRRPPVATSPMPRSAWPRSRLACALRLGALSRPLVWQSALPLSLPPPWKSAPLHRAAPWIVKECAPAFQNLLRWACCRPPWRRGSLRTASRTPPRPPRARPPTRCLFAVRLGNVDFVAQRVRKSTIVSARARRLARARALLGGRRRTYGEGLHWRRQEPASNLPRARRQAGRRRRPPSAPAADPSARQDKPVDGVVSVEGGALARVAPASPDETSQITTLEATVARLGTDRLFFGGRFKRARRPTHVCPR